MGPSALDRNAALRCDRQQHPDREVPASVRRFWDVVVRHLDTPLLALREGREVEVCDALLTLHAMADEACSGLAPGAGVTSDGPPERTAWARLERRG
jgi:hypothetical protein